MGVTKGDTRSLDSSSSEQVTVVIEWDGGKRETHTFRILGCC